MTLKKMKRVKPTIETAENVEPRRATPPPAQKARRKRPGAPVEEPVVEAQPEAQPEEAAPKKGAAAKRASKIMATAGAANKAPRQGGKAAKALAEELGIRTDTYSAADRDTLLPALEFLDELGTAVNGLVPDGGTLYLVTDPGHTLFGSYVVFKGKAVSMFGTGNKIAAKTVPGDDSITLVPGDDDGIDNLVTKLASEIGADLA